MVDKFNEGLYSDIRPAHPRGWIGGMIANKLIKAGWEYGYFGALREMMWYKPDKPDELHYLESAHWAQFGTGL